ncbi:MAG: WecB/TagA/CpsF family glycosyltransferase [Defluviitaleaceae bacterium]|nr:WecB/TagA/CpsF family glycosyltransferase [Defluviitaleaceae bacterium]
MTKKTTILNVPVDATTPGEALSTLLGFLDEKRSHLLVTPNPEMIMLANKDPEFMRVMKSADLVVPDGIGAVMASRLNEVKIKGRVTGYDLMLALFGKIAQDGQERKVYLFGAKPGVAEAAREKLIKEYPGLSVVGTHDGYFTAEQENSMIKEIIDKQPDILVIGMSMGMSEKWADAHRGLPVRLMACVGGAIDGWAGNVPRAPLFFRRLGLEWFYRLIRQPSRRWRRQLVLPVFAWKVIWGKVTGR